MDGMIGLIIIEDGLIRYKIENESHAILDLLVTLDPLTLWFFSLFTLSNSRSSYLAEQSPLRLMRCTCWLISSSVSLLLLISMMPVSLYSSPANRCLSACSSFSTFASSSSSTVFPSWISF
jgi:hypothetical protein